MALKGKLVAMIDKILERLKSYNKNFDFERIKKALHLLNKNLADALYSFDLVLHLYPDEDMLIAVLIKEVFDRGEVSEDQVKSDFGAGVLNILHNVKKLEKLKYAENDKSSQLEILRKMFLAMAKDIRVVLICLVGRLHQMHHQVFYMSERDRVAFAKETLELYVPIADRLGIYSVKTDLEDLAFKYSNPEMYHNISEQLEKLRKSCDISMSLISKKLQEFFKERGVQADVSGRIKSIYSIYKKLKRKNLSSVLDLYDVFAMRVILPPKVDEEGREVVDHLYGVLGMIHSEWKPISKKFKDYIAVPKSNGYRSLHTVVLGLAPKDFDQPVEIQIRESNMHRDAEYGIASHWLYKQLDGKVSRSAEVHMDWIRGLENVHDELVTDEDVAREFQVDLFKDRIFVLTPRGEVKDLPQGSGPIDFAYAVHTEIGNKCVMAKVDGRIVPLDYELKNGEVVEIVTRKDAIPKIQWLSMVKSSFARNRIKAFFSALNKEGNVKEGKRLINAQLARLNKAPLDNNYSILKKFEGKSINLSEREHLVEEVGRGLRLSSDVVKKVYPYENFVSDDVVVSDLIEGRKAKGIKSESLENEILIGGEGGLPLKLAACCQPRPGDHILGYVTRGNSITIHNAECILLGALDNERIIFAEWKGGKRSPEKLYLVGIRVLLVSRIGLMSDMTAIMAQMGVNIRDVSVNKVKSGLIEDYFLLEFDDLDKFDQLVDKLEKVQGVLKIIRDERFKERSKVK